MILEICLKQLVLTLILTESTVGSCILYLFSSVSVALAPKTSTDCIIDIARMGRRKMTVLPPPPPVPLAIGGDSMSVKKVASRQSFINDYLLRSGRQTKLTKLTPAMGEIAGKDQFDITEDAICTQCSYTETSVLIGLGENRQHKRRSNSCPILDAPAVTLTEGE